MVMVLGAMVTGYLGCVGLFVWSVARYPGKDPYDDDELVPTWIPWTFGWCVGIGAVFGLIGLLTSPRPGPDDPPARPTSERALEVRSWLVGLLLHLVAIAIVFFGAPDSKQRWLAVGAGLLPIMVVPIMRATKIVDP